MTVTEHELAAHAAKTKGLRIAEADLEAAIFSIHTFTARHGVLGELASDGVKATEYERRAAHPSLSLLTIAVLVLRNGFTVTGESACADPAMFDAEIGKRLAIADAKRKVWSLLGYALRDRMHDIRSLHAAIDS